VDLTYHVNVSVYMTAILTSEPTDGFQLKLVWTSCVQMSPYHCTVHLNH